MLRDTYPKPRSPAAILLLLPRNGTGKRTLHLFSSSSTCSGRFTLVIAAMYVSTPLSSYMSTPLHPVSPAVSLAVSCPK
jgi:hypothetical protein